MAEAKSNAMPAPGQKAPEFEGKTQTGETVRLTDFHGKRVAVFFYPKDDTSGCTKQACNLRDQYQDLLDAGIAVVGVSGDDERSHKKFADKYSLPFPLIADPDHHILESYGVWGDKSMYGRIFKGTKRTTFLIDESGKIRDVITKPNVSEHAEEVIAAFEGRS